MIMIKQVRVMLSEAHTGSALSIEKPRARETSWRACDTFLEIASVGEGASQTGHVDVVCNISSQAGGQALA